VEPEDVTSPPADGVFVGGLWLEGARWDTASGCLAAPEPGAMLSPLPVVHLRPQQGGRATPPEGTYACPLYKTSARWLPGAGSGLKENGCWAGLCLYCDAGVGQILDAVSQGHTGCLRAQTTTALSHSLASTPDHAYPQTQGGLVVNHWAEHQLRAVCGASCGSWHDC
jgi:hypothetical protein